MRSTMKIKMTTLNFWVDAVTGLVLLLEIWTGLLIRFVLPPGQGRGKNWLLWGLNRHAYGSIHFYLAIAMIVLVLIHLWLHWAWVCSVFRNLLGRSVPEKKTRALWGIGLLLMVAGLIAATLFWANTLVVK